VVNFFQNIRFAEEGLYWVEVSLEGTLVTRYPFRVARAPQRPPAGP